MPPGRIGVFSLGAALLVAALGGGCAGGTGTSAASARGASADSGAEYTLYVANESSDVVSRVRFVPGEGASVEREIPVGIMPADTDAPHGLAVSPDGAHFYVTLAHGTPYGWLWKFRAGPDTLVDRVELGRFPASAGLDPGGNFVFVVNFNLHGDMVPSDLSIVHAGSMTEVARIPTCLMPHGSRVNPGGTRHYSVCMHSDQLVEVDLRRLEVSGRFSLAPGSEGELALDDRGKVHHPHADQDPGPMVHIPEVEDGRPLPRPGAHHAHQHGAVCSPTWVAPGRGGGADRFVYVACNGSDEVLEVDVVDWQVVRRWQTEAGPYNLEVSSDGRLLVVTLRRAGGVEVFDLERGERLGRLETSRPVTHGVVISEDTRYAFISNESVGADRGTMDVFDLAQLERVASVELRHQPTGIDLWKEAAPGSGGTATP